MPSMRFIPSGGNQININNVTFDRGIRTPTSDFRETRSHSNSVNVGCSHGINLGDNPPTYEEAVHQHSVINSNNT